MGIEVSPNTYLTHIRSYDITLFFTDLALPRNPHVVGVAKHQITVSWDAPEGQYDRLRLICTSVDGKHQETVDATRRHSESDKMTCTCVCLNSGTQYAITLVTILDSSAAEPQLFIMDQVFKTGMP